jgi:hypothetical protein
MLPIPEKYLFFFSCYPDSNAEGEIECAIALIKDDNIQELKCYQVYKKSSFKIDLM